MKQQKFALFRVRQEYFDQIRAGTKNVELRKDSRYWRTHLICQHPPDVALFLCGKRQLARRIVSIRANQDPEAILGRPLSEQGRQDIPTPTCFAIFLGEVVTGRERKQKSKMTKFWWQCKSCKKIFWTLSRDVRPTCPCGANKLRKIGPYTVRRLRLK